MSDYVARVSSNIKLESIENFIEIEPIRKLIGGIDPNSLDDKSKESVLAFNKALDKREKGISDEW